MPEQAEEIQARRWVCAHIKDAGHRGVVAALQRLQGHCCWFHLEVYVKQCLHFMNSKAGVKIPRPLVETVHGTGPGEILHFDLLYVGDGVPVNKDGVYEGDGFKHILVMMDDLSNSVWLGPTESCTAASTARHLLRWCKILAVPEIWVSDTASHTRGRCGWNTGLWWLICPRRTALVSG